MKKKIYVFYEIIMSILAVFAVYLAIVDLSDRLNGWQKTADSIILAIFVVDYFVRLLASDDKKAFFKTNVLDLIAILPFNSFFRAFRTARLARVLKVAKIFKFAKVLSYIARMLKKTKTFFDTNGFKYIVVLNCAFIVIGGIAIHFAEKMTLPDGLWWAFVTATTVGYGDIAPSSISGRIIAIVLMLGGIGLIGSLTSTITSFFFNKNNETLTHKGEIFALVQSQLNDYENLSDDDIDRLCEILQSCKEK